MDWRRVRTRLRFAKSRRRVASRLDAWPQLVLNCPLCGQHLAPREARGTHVYACSGHGDWFAAAEDGRLYDVQKVRPGAVLAFSGSATGLMTHPLESLRVFGAV
jgi:hypothetical protein